MCALGENGQVSLTFRWCCFGLNSKCPCSKLAHGWVTNMQLDLKRRDGRQLIEVAIFLVLSPMRLNLSHAEADLQPLLFHLWRSTNPATLFATNPIRSCKVPVIRIFLSPLSLVQPFLYFFFFCSLWWMALLLGQMTAPWLIVCSLSLFCLLTSQEIFYRYLGLPHQHIPINKRGGEVGMERRGVEGSVAQRQGSGHEMEGWKDTEGRGEINCSRLNVKTEREKEMKWEWNATVKDYNIDRWLQRLCKKFNKNIDR